MTESTPHPLARVITNTKARQVIYGTYVVGLVGLGAAQAGYAALDAVQPEWMTAALAVAAFLGVPVGALALANSPTVDVLPIPDAADDEAVNEELDTLLFGEDASEFENNEEEDTDDLLEDEDDPR